MQVEQRGVAQFFFEIGYGACFAEGYIRNGSKAPWPMSDAEVERAWEVAGEAHDDPEEFDRYLALAGEASLPPSAPVDRPLVEDLTGALRFILAFYEPGQRYLDSEAWKCAEAGGRAALARGEAALATPSVLAESTSNDCLLVAEGWQDEAGLADQGCRIPPNGWHCTRERGHDGPCAAHRVGRPVGAGWSPVPQGEATHDERLTDDELSALGLGVSEWAYKHLARGYAVSLSVREIKRLIAALSRTSAVTDLSGVGVG